MEESRIVGHQMGIATECHNDPHRFTGVGFRGATEVKRTTDMTNC